VTSVCVQVVNTDAHEFLRVCDGAADGCDKPIYMQATSPDKAKRLPDWAIILIIVGSVAFAAFLLYVLCWQPHFYQACVRCLIPTRHTGSNGPLRYKPVSQLPSMPYPADFAYNHGGQQASVPYPAELGSNYNGQQY
jgi:hypothetical protein